MKKNKKNIQWFIIIILFISCYRHYNSEKTTTVVELEKITKNDISALQELNTIDVENSLKIAKLNLSKIEEKKLDSIEIRLIYFEYHNYLNCVNKLYENFQNINALKKTLTKNQFQLKNIKSDYKNSRERRVDLDKHLLHEKNIVNKTSNKVFNTIKAINEEQIKFDNLNSKIEEILN